MPLSGWFALVDGVVAVALLLSATRQRRNKAGVIAVAAVLLGISGWLGVLALDHGQARRVPVPVPVPVAGTDGEASAGAGGDSGGVGVGISRT